MPNKNYQVVVTAPNGDRIPIGKPTTTRVGAQLRAMQLAHEFTSGDETDEAAVFQSRATRGAKSTFGDVQVEIEEE